MINTTEKYLITSTDGKLTALIEQRDTFKDLLIEGYRPALENFGIWLQEHGFMEGEHIGEIVEKFIKTKQFL